MKSVQDMVNESLGEAEEKKSTYSVALVVKNTDLSEGQLAIYLNKFIKKLEKENKGTKTELKMSDISRYN